MWIFSFKNLCCRREQDNLEAERAQHLKQIHDLQEHIQEKENKFLALEEQVVPLKLSFFTYALESFVSHRSAAYLSTFFQVYLSSGFHEIVQVISKDIVFELPRNLETQHANAEKMYQFLKMRGRNI